MKLLHPEVDIIPGRPGQRPSSLPVQEGVPVPGSVVVRLHNDTPQENAYTVRIKCEQPFWLESWYTLSALPPAPGAQNAPPPGRADQHGPQERWVKVYVPRDGTRDILVRFNVPQRPESRAGKYAYTIEVETQVIGQAEAGRRKERMTTLPGIAMVRPFYKWSLDLSPQNPVRVGRRKRAADFEVVVTNEGNDWLYCDVKMTQPKDLLLESVTQRMAVPPPELGDILRDGTSGEERLGVQRTVPLRAMTRLKNWRGEPVPLSLPVTAVRVDAPSVVPPPNDPNYAGEGTVLGVVTTETQIITGERGLVYNPPIPAKLTAAFTQSGGAVRGLILTFIGLVIAFNFAVIMYQQMFFNGIRADPLAGEVAPGGKLYIEGKYLQGAAIDLISKEGNKKGEVYEVEAKPLFNRWEKVYVTVPKDLDRNIIRIKAKRGAGVFTLLGPLLPSYDSKEEVQVGAGPPAQTASNPGLDHPINPIPEQPKNPTPDPTKNPMVVQPKNPKPGQSNDITPGQSKDPTLKQPKDPKPVPPPNPTPNPAVKPDVTQPALDIFNKVIGAATSDIPAKASDALSKADGLIKQNNTSAMAYALKGYLLQLIYNPKSPDDNILVKANALLNQALQMDPNNYLALTGLGSYYFRKQNYDDAARTLLKATQINPNFAFAHYNLSRAYLKQNKLDEAMNECNTAINQNGNIAGFWAQKAAIYQAQGNDKDAQDSAAKYQEIDGNKK